MRAVIVRRFGGSEVLEFGELPTPSPGPGEVLVRLGAIGVNFADTERRRGTYAVPELPWTPGREGAGEVVAAGPGVDAE
jgi:NADPH:quinone reductase